MATPAAMGMVAPVHHQRSFPLGQLVATPGAIDAMARSGDNLAVFIARHARCDWGDVGAEDWRLNDQALVGGERILSAYSTSGSHRIWIVTEADRSVTTALLPDEY